MCVKRSICRNLNKMGRKTLASSCYRPCGIQLTSRPESSRWSKSVSCWTVHYWKHKARLRREALATWQQKLFETSASKGSALCRILVLSVFCTKMGFIEWDLSVCLSVHPSFWHKQVHQRMCTSESIAQCQVGAPQYFFLLLGHLLYVITCKGECPKTDTDGSEPPV